MEKNEIDFLAYPVNAFIFVAETLANSFYFILIAAFNGVFF